MNRGTFTNPSRWYDPAQADNGTWLGSGGDDEEFTLSLVTYDPPSQRKRNQEQRRAKHIKDDFYHGADEGFVGSGARPQGRTEPPRYAAPEEGVVEDARVDSFETDGLDDDAWSAGWGDWDDKSVDAVGDQQLAGANEDTRGRDDVDALLEELQYVLPCCARMVWL